MAKKNKKLIKSFHDLEVYQNSYDASLKVIEKIIPKLPKEEQWDLSTQMRRSCKAVHRLIAEGYAKSNQKKGFQKYLDDSRAESNEMIVSLSHCRDLYHKYVDVGYCNELIDTYDKTSRQLFNLSNAWSQSKRKENDKRKL